MKFTLDKASLEAFNKNGWVELEGIFTSEQVSEINRKIDRLITDKKLDKKDEIMTFGHNLFHKIEEYKQLLQLKSLAEIVYELTSIKPLTLAFDQLYQTAVNSFDQARNTDFFKGTKKIQEVSPVNELVLGVMITLKGSEAVFPFAEEAGRAYFFKPDTEIPFEVLKSRLGERYLMLAFSTNRAQYLLNENDPVNHYLKKMGYVYGDRLKETDFPIIFR